jgi:hypothetical protein
VETTPLGEPPLLAASRKIAFLELGNSLVGPANLVHSLTSPIYPLANSVTESLLTLRQILDPQTTLRGFWSFHQPTWLANCASVALAQQMTYLFQSSEVERKLAVLHQT